MPNSQQFLRDLDKKLWSAADRLRANLDAAVYKHALLGLIFLKYVSDSFALRQREIEAELRDPTSAYFLDSADYGGEGSVEYLEAIRGIDLNFGKEPPFNIREGAKDVALAAGATVCAIDWFRFQFPR